MSSIASQASLAGTARDLVSLTKPRVTSLVLVTTAGGMWLAPGERDGALAAVMLVCTALVVASANALNCWLERDVDRYMSRTAARPLPAGRLDPRLALGFGLALGLVSVPIMAFAVNPLTGLVAATALVSYVAAYTPLKQRTPSALLVGAVPGALPPLMGWTAVTGRLDAPALALFGLLFVWQLPHFIAIAIFRKDEYRRAGLRVLPAVRGERVAALHAAVWAAVLVPVSLLPVPLGVAGRLYLVVAAVLGSAFLLTALAGLRRSVSRRWARTLFFTSLVYLPLVFAALLVDAG